MKSMGMTLMLRDDPDGIAQYKADHAAVWPEVVAELRKAGVIDMKIFLRDRRLFMFAQVPDGFDPAVEWPKLSLNPRYAEWEERMGALQEKAPEAGPDEWWAEMELVFELPA